MPQHENDDRENNGKQRVAEPREQKGALRLHRLPSRRRSQWWRRYRVERRAYTFFSIASTKCVSKKAVKSGNCLICFSASMCSA